LPFWQFLPQHSLLRLHRFFKRRQAAPVSRVPAPANTAPTAPAMVAVTAVRREAVSASVFAI
jgi:hypothetical protein